jgi:hypothetical protein
MAYAARKIGVPTSNLLKAASPISNLFGAGGSKKPPPGPVDPEQARRLSLESGAQFESGKMLKTRNEMARSRASTLLSASLG